MQSYLAIEKGKVESVLFKMVLCLWICRDSKILKFVILYDVPIIVKSRICALELQEMPWPLILLWHGWEMGMFVFRLTPAYPGVKSATGRANVARRAPRATVFIYYTGSQSTREVVFVTKHWRYDLSIALSNWLCLLVRTILGVTSLMYLESKDASSILSLSDWGSKYGS